MAVDEAAVLEAGLVPDAAAAESCLFEHAHRGPVAGVDDGLQPHDAAPAETVGDGRLQRLRHDAPAPQGLGQPVARLGAEAFDVAARREGDAADRLAVHVDAVVHRLRAGCRGADEALGVAARIGVRQRVAAVVPDVSVVEVPGQRLAVRRLPASENRPIHGARGV